MTSNRRLWRNLGTALWAATLAACGVSEQQQATSAKADGSPSAMVAEATATAPAFAQVSQSLAAKTLTAGLLKLNGGAAWSKSMTVAAELTVPAGAAPATGWSYCINESATDPCTVLIAVPAAPRRGKPTVDYVIQSANASTGAATLYVTFNDEKLTTSSATIKVDTTAPTGGSLSAAPKAGGSVPLTWSGFSSVPSAIASYRVMASSTAVPADCVGTPVATVTGDKTSYEHAAGGAAVGKLMHYRVCAVDEAGNISAGVARENWRVQSETIAPVVAEALTVTVAPSHTAKTAVVATVKGTVTDSNTKVMVFVKEGGQPGIDDAAWKPYVPAGTTFNATLAGDDGSKTLKAYFKDESGNRTVEAGAKSATVVLDRAAPSQTGVLEVVPSAVVGSTTRTMVTVSYTAATDSGGGAVSTVVMQAATLSALGAGCVGGTAVKATDVTSTKASFEATRNTAVAIRVCARDVAGNVSAGLVWTGFVGDKGSDTTAPVTTGVTAKFYATATGTAELARTGRQDVFVKVAGITTDVKAVCVNDGAAACDHAAAWVANTATSVSLPARLPAGDGDKKLAVWLRDAVGNISSKVETSTIALDTTAPTQSGAVTAIRTASADKIQVALTYSAATDADSSITTIVMQGAAAIPAKCASGTPVGTATATSANFQATKGSKVFVRVCARDSQGNVSAGLAWEGTARLEDAAPQIAGVGFVVEPAVTSNGRVTAKFSGSEPVDANGPVSVCVTTAATPCAAAAEWKPFASNIPYSLSVADTKTQGDKTIRVWFRDALGNTTAQPLQATTKFDSLAPAGGTLTVEPAVNGLKLTVNGLSDASGITSYVVSAKAGTAVPTVKCTTDVKTCTAIGNVLTCTNGFIAGTAYAVRVCAKDGASPALTSDGLTGSGRAVGTLTAPTVSSFTVPTWTGSTRKTELTYAAAADGAAKVKSWCVLVGSDDPKACVWTSFATAATSSTGKVTFDHGTRASNGAKALAFFVQDDFGNVSAKQTGTTTLDTVAPGAGTVMAARGESDTSVALTLGGFADVDLAPDFQFFRAEGATAPKCTETPRLISCTKSGAAYGCTGFDRAKSYTVAVCAKDGAGNTSPAATTFVKAAPADVAGITASIADTAVQSKTGTYAVTLTTIPSGVTKVCTKVGADAEVCAARPASGAVVTARATVEGMNLPVKVRFQDANGTNSPELTANKVVTFDKSAPVVGIVSLVKTSATAVSLTPSGFSDLSTFDYVLVQAAATSATTAPATPEKCLATSPKIALTGGAYALTELKTGFAYSVRVCAVDALGNFNADGLVLNFRASANAAAPSAVSVSLTGAAVKTIDGTVYATSVNVLATVSATAATGRKIAKLCVTDGATCAPATVTPAAATSAWSTSGFKVGLSAVEGPKTVTAIVEDEDGNQSRATTSVTLDTKAPVEGNVVAARLNAAAALTLSGYSDATSGLDGVVVRQVVKSPTTTAAPANCTTAGTASTVSLDGSVATVTGLENGSEYFFRVCAKDKVGNLSAGKTAGPVKPAVVYAAPGVTLTLAAGASAVKASPATVVLTATPAPGGTVAKYAISDADVLPAASVWKTATGATLGAAWSKNDLTQVFTTSKEGPKTLFAWVEDNAGNIGKAQLSFTFDKTAPVVSTVTAEQLADRRVKLNVVATDAGVGLDTAQYEVKALKAAAFSATAAGVVTLSCNADLVCSWPVTPDRASWALSVVIKDRLGNAAAAFPTSITPVPSVTKPTLSAVAVADAQGQARAFVNRADVFLIATGEAKNGANLTSFCAVNGVATTCSAWSGIPGTPASLQNWRIPFTLAPGAGDKTITVWLKDEHGNVSAPATVTVKVDLVKPTDGAAASFVLTPSVGSFQLAWAAGSDVAPGTLAGYVATAVEGAGFPADFCENGTTLTGCSVGAATLTCTGTGLKKSTTYGVRLCAVDVAGNRSKGVAGSGVTLDASGCLIAGQPYGEGDRNPDNGCQFCAGSNPSQWSVSAQNTACKNNLNADGVCAGGGDATCVANNQCYFQRVGAGGVLEANKSLLATGALDGTCGVCDPSTNRWAASPVASGKAVNVGPDLTFCDGTGATAAASKGVCEMTNNGTNVNALDAGWRARTENTMGEWQSAGPAVGYSVAMMVPSGATGIIFATHNEIHKADTDGSSTHTTLLVSNTGCWSNYAGLGVKSDGTVVWSCNYYAQSTGVVIHSRKPDGASSSVTISGADNAWSYWSIGVGANDQIYLAGASSGKLYSVASNGAVTYVRTALPFYSVNTGLWSNGIDAYLYSNNSWEQFLYASTSGTSWSTNSGRYFVSTDGTVYRKSGSTLSVRKPGAAWASLGTTQREGSFVVTTGGLLWETNYGSNPRPMRFATVMSDIAKSCGGAGASGCVVRTVSGAANTLTAYARDAFKTPLKQTLLGTQASPTGYREFQCDPGSAAGKYALKAVDYSCPAESTATKPAWRAGTTDLLSNTQFCHSGILKGCPPGGGGFIAVAGVCSCWDGSYHTLANNACSPVTQTCTGVTVWGRDNGGEGCGQCRAKQAANGVWLNEVELRAGATGSSCRPATAGAKLGGGVCTGTSTSCTCPAGYVTNLSDGLCLRPDAVANPSSGYDQYGAAPGYDRYGNPGGSFPGYVSQDADVRAKGGWTNETQNAIACGNYFWSLSNHICKSRYCGAGQTFNRSANACVTCPVNQTSDAGFEPTCHSVYGSGSSSGCDGWYALADAYQTYDSVANLYWEDPMSTAGGPVTFEAAKKYCAELNKQPGIKATGAQKWRLPTWSEVQSWGSHYSQKVCRNDGNFGMFSYVGTPFWFSDSSNTTQGHAAVIFSGTSSDYGAQQTSATHYVRCVHQ